MLNNQRVNPHVFILTPPLIGTAHVARFLCTRKDVFPGWDGAKIQTSTGWHGGIIPNGGWFQSRKKKNVIRTNWHGTSDIYSDIICDTFTEQFSMSFAGKWSSPTVLVHKYCYFHWGHPFMLVCWITIISRNWLQIKPQRSVSYLNNRGQSAYSHHSAMEIQARTLEYEETQQQIMYLHMYMTIIEQQNMDKCPNPLLRPHLNPYPHLLVHIYIVDGKRMCWYKNMCFQVLFSCWCMHVI